MANPPGEIQKEMAGNMGLVNTFFGDLAGQVRNAPFFRLLPKNRKLLA
jgi:hypothetical protein